MDMITAKRFGEAERPDLSSSVVGMMLWEFRLNNPGVMTKKGNAYVFRASDAERVRRHLHSKEAEKRASGASSVKFCNHSKEQTLMVRGEKIVFETVPRMRKWVEKALTEMSDLNVSLQERIAEQEQEIERMKSMLRDAKPFAMVGIEMDRLRQRGIKPVFRVRAQTRPFLQAA